MDGIEKLYFESENRFIYNPIEKSIDFRGRRATDYKLNRSVKLPKPLPAEDEFQCEVRRRSYLAALEAYREFNKLTEMKRRKKRRKKNTKKPPGE